jgi:hypothetical protein
MLASHPTDLSSIPGIGEQVLGKKGAIMWQNNTGPRDGTDANDDVLQLRKR